ncbi:hypothetical protein BY458DRAFT_518600 [Sporodiniella umbellata]|nr:hypothetical protein BY458DRAFT_518600 [Sporodiniella umbellata]
MFQALVKPTTILSAFARRNLSVASVLRTDGATASSREFGEKERAAEKQWARKHVSSFFSCCFLYHKGVNAVLRYLGC